MNGDGIAVYDGPIISDSGVCVKWLKSRGFCRVRVVVESCQPRSNAVQSFPAILCIKVMVHADVYLSMQSL